MRSTIQPCRPLRVLFFDHVATLSGGEIALLNLVRNLDRNLVDPIVLLGEDGPLLEKLRGVAPVHLLPMAGDVAHARKDALGVSSLLRLGTGAVTYVIRLASFMRSQHADVVHTNSLKSDILGGLAARLAGIPVVWHVRDRIADDYLPAKVVKVFRLLCHILPTAIIANSHATAETVASGLSKRLVVVHDGTDVFAATERNAGRTVIGLVGRISPWKGQDVFLRAAALLRARYPEAVFRLIGAPLFNEMQYDAELHRLTVELGLQDAVEFAGFCGDVPAEIAALTVLVHASTRAEPFGQVIIEGMAAGVPVVATNGGGVPEIVTDRVTGLLVPMGDAPAMARAVDSLLRDAHAAQAMGERGRQEVERRFSIQKTAREMEQALLRFAQHHAQPVNEPKAGHRNATGGLRDA